MASYEWENDEGDQDLVSGSQRSSINHVEDLLLEEGSLVDEMMDQHYLRNCEYYYKQVVELKANEGYGFSGDRYIVKDGFLGSEVYEFIRMI